jgi:hypothetical protein
MRGPHDRRGLPVGRVLADAPQVRGLHLGRDVPEHAPALPRPHRDVSSVHRELGLRSRAAGVRSPTQPTAGTWSWSIS